MPCHANGNAKLDASTAAPQDRPGYLIVIPWDLEAPGGVSQVVINLHRELRAVGWLPTVLVPTWTARIPEFDSSGQIPVLRWHIRSPWCRGNVTKGFIAFLVSLPKVGSIWRRLAQRHNWHIVNAHYPDFWAFTWIALKRLGFWRGMVVISVHGREVRDTINVGGPVQRWLMRLLLVQSDAVVACATDLAEDVVRIAPRAGNHVWVIPNGVNAAVLRAEFDPGFQLPAELASRRFVLNVATFEHKKSQDVLIDAFTLLAARHADVDLVMIGRSTPWLDEVRRRAAASGVADRMHFFLDLPHEQILSFMSRASVFCLPSRSEGHPLAILEAAVFGIPVVATPVGGIPETITDESHGLLVPVADVRALADALNRLLANPEFARTVGRNLQRRVESEFTWARAAQQYTELARCPNQAATRPGNRGNSCRNT